MALGDSIGLWFLQWLYLPDVFAAPDRFGTDGLYHGPVCNLGSSTGLDILASPTQLAGDCWHVVGGHWAVSALQCTGRQFRRGCSGIPVRIELCRPDSGGGKIPA